jgi:hypothetical protein
VKAASYLDTGHWPTRTSPSGLAAPDVRILFIASILHLDGIALRLPAVSEI